MNDPLSTLSVAEADAAEATYQEERAKRFAPTVERGTATIGVMQILPTGYDDKEQVHIPFEKVVVAAEGAPRGPLEGDSFVWRVNSPAKLTDNSALGYFVRSGRALDSTIDGPRQLEGKRVAFEMVTLQNGNDRSGQPLNPTVTYKITSFVGASSAGSNGNSPTYTKEELYEAYEGAQGMMFPDAKVAFGSKIDRLILGKAQDQSALGFKLKVDEGKLVADVAS